MSTHDIAGWAWTKNATGSYDIVAQNEIIARVFPSKRADESIDIETTLRTAIMVARSADTLEALVHAVIAIEGAISALKNGPQGVQTAGEVTGLQSQLAVATRALEQARGER